MRKIIMTITMIMMMVLTGCSNDNPEVLEPEENPVHKEPTIILKEEQEKDEPVIYGLGERAVVRDDYAVTILSVEDTDYRLPWSPEQENIVVEVLFENLSMDEEHEVFNYETGLVTGFNLRIQNGSPYPPTVLNDFYRTSFTPAGAKSMHKLIYKSPAHPEAVKFSFADYDRNDLIFEAERGKRIEADLGGELPKPEIIYGKGDPISTKDYTVTVNSVKKVEIDRTDPNDFTTGADYEVELEFLEVDLDEFYKRTFRIIPIDEQGNTGYVDYNKGNTEENEDGDGVRISLVFSVHTDSEKLMLHYTDSILDRNVAFYIEIDEID